MADLNFRVPALEKLLEYTASGIGAIGGPILARWTARTKADARRIEASGHADAIRIIADAHDAARRSFDDSSGDLSSVTGMVDINREIQSRLDFQEHKRQTNVRSIVEESAGLLSDKNVDNHEPDHDWVARFFADAQDVSSDHMRKIWARILAGEVESPGRTSLHTLAILKNMTQRDSELFARAAKFAVFDSLANPAFMGRTAGYPSVEELIHLDSYHLVTFAPQLQISLPVNNEGVARIRDGKSFYRLSFVDATESRKRQNGISIDSYPLTPQGKQLRSIVDPDPNWGYLVKLARYLEERMSCTLEWSRVAGSSGNRIVHGPWTLIGPTTDE